MVYPPRQSFCPRVYVFNYSEGSLSTDARPAGLSLGVQTGAGSRCAYLKRTAGHRAFMSIGSPSAGWSRSPLQISDRLRQNAEALMRSAGQGLDTFYAGGDQRCAVGWRHAQCSVKTKETDFRGEQNEVGFRPGCPKPWRTRAVGNRCNTIAVAEECIEPRLQTVPTTERRVHPDESMPVARIFQAAVVFRQPAFRRHVPPLAGGSDVEIERAA